jgi:hypothetical protein
MRWYYFIRAGDRLLLRRDGATVPHRPVDSNPDNGDPLTPWYTTEDHMDESHVHVRAHSEEEACDKAVAMLSEQTFKPVRRMDAVEGAAL